MKKLLAVLAIMLCVACATPQPQYSETGWERDIGTIGPCFGGGGIGGEMYACFYDVSYDSIPDIILIYAWTGEKMLLIDAGMMPLE